MKDLPSQYIIISEEMNLKNKNNWHFVKNSNTLYVIRVFLINVQQFEYYII